MSIGEVLAQERDEAGLTTAQVSQRTRIRETIIREIEDDDYSECGGDFYARGHIRSIARTVGADPEPLIREYDRAHRAPGAMSAVSMTELAGSGPPDRRWVWLAVLGLALAAVLGFAVYSLLSGSGPAKSSRPAAGRSAVIQRHSRRTAARPAAHRSRSLPAAAPAPRAAGPPQSLSPVSVAAFGFEGSGQGDNPQLADGAIDGNPATAWQTDWYTTARFGNLYPGTGLLLNMGRPVTITSARISLGSAPGASLQLRVGEEPALTGLRLVADAADARGVVRLGLAAPVRARYVLIWFTSLPRNPAGTFQASVYDIRLVGHA
jgi:Helix-turn-helix domain